MYSGRKPKHYKKSQAQNDYRAYSQSDTSLRSSAWEYAENPRERKHVKFDKRYDNSSRDIYHEYNQPYYYGSSNMYDSENEIFDYDSDDSRYTYYHQSPQHIMYTGTDSALTIGDSDYESIDFGYQPKNRHNYNHSNKKNNYASSKNRNIKASPLREDLAVYFAQQPTNTFKYKESKRQNELSQSESEFQTGSVTEMEEESDYPADDKRNKVDYQIYAANLTENENNGAFMKNLTKKKSDYPADDKGNKLNCQIYAANLDGNENNGAFKKDLTKNNQEKVISVTEYDNIPILAFKTKNTDVSPQKSDSRVVYLPVLVTAMQSKENIFSTQNNNTQNFSGKNVVAAEKPINSINVYAAVNEQTNMFEKSIGKSHGNAQYTDKTEENKQQKSTVVKGENSDSSPDRFSKNTNRKSSRKPVLQRPVNTSQVNLPSILKLPGARKSKSFVNVELTPSDKNKLDQNEIKVTTSNVTVISRNSIPEGRKSLKTPTIGPQDKETVKYTNSDNKDKKRLSKTKSNNSNVSKKSINSNVFTRKKSNAQKRSDMKTTSQCRPLIGETPPGSEEGCNYYAATHWREKINQELTHKKKETARKSKIIQDEREPKTSFSSKRRKESVFSMAKKSQDNNKIYSREKLKISQSDIKPDESEIQALSKPHQNCRSNKDLSGIQKENETKNRTQSYIKQISIRPQRRGASVTNIIINVPSQVPDNNNYKYEGDTKAKLVESKTSNQNKSEPVIRKSVIARESTPVKDSKTSNKKSIMLGQENNTANKEENKQLSGSPPSNQNKSEQSTKKSITARESTIPDTMTSSPKKDKSEGNKTDIGKKSLVKETVSTEETIKSQLLNPNQTGQDIKKSVIDKKEDPQQLNESKKYQSQAAEDVKEILQRRSQVKAAEEVKEILRRRSQIKEYISRENITEDPKKSNVTHTSGPIEEIQFSGKRKSQVFREETKEKVNEEIRKSFASRGITDEKDKWSSKTLIQSPVAEKKSQLNQVSDIKPEDKTVTKNIGLGSNATSFATSGITYEKDKMRSKILMQSPLAERKSQLNQISNIKPEEKTVLTKNISLGTNATSIRQNQSSVGNKVKKEGSTANLSEQKTTYLESECSKVNLNNNQKNISLGNYIPVGEQKHQLRKGKSQQLDDSSNIIVQKRISSDQKVKNAEIENAKVDKISQKTLSDNSSHIDQTPNQSKRPSHGKEASNIKSSSISEQTKISKIENLIKHPITVWGQDISTWITYCFRICQFFLGVSTYDKFIEVLGNFH